MFNLRMQGRVAAAAAAAARRTCTFGVKRTTASFSVLAGTTKSPYVSHPYLAKNTNPMHSSSLLLSARQQSTATATAAYDQTVDVFPSIIIGPNRSIVPVGTFAEAQAQVRICLFLVIFIIRMVYVHLSDCRNVV
jgi:hypothetical protein